MIPIPKRKKRTREQRDAENLRARQKKKTREQLDAKNLSRKALLLRNPDRRRAYRHAYDANAKARGTWHKQRDAKNAQARKKRAERTPEQRDADSALWRKRYATDAEYREKKVTQNRVNNKKRKPPTREELDVRAARQREGYAADAAMREKVNADNRRRYATNRATKPEKLLARDLKKYGIGPAHYQMMLDEQGGACAICERPPANKKRLHVDHCHVTRRVRGLLCTKCNFGAGLFDDDPGRLERAALYLRTAVK